MVADCVYALAATVKRPVTPEYLLRTHSTFSMSVIVSIGVSILGLIDVIFIDAGVKINGRYYREVPLTQKLLPVMCETCAEFVFQLPARCECETFNILKLQTPAFISSHLYGTPTAQIWTHLTTKYGDKCNSKCTSSWHQWTEVSLDRCLACFWAKRHRWRTWQVVQTSLCMY